MPSSCTLRLFHRGIAELAAVGLQGESSAPGEQFMAENSVRVEHVVLAQVDGVVVLDDAAHLGLGQVTVFAGYFIPLAFRMDFSKAFPSKLTEPLGRRGMSPMLLSSLKNGISMSYLRPSPSGS